MNKNINNSEIFEHLMDIKERLARIEGSISEKNRNNNINIPTYTAILCTILSALFGFIGSKF